MRIVFMGTPEFSAVILKKLAATHEVVGVYTRPDAVRGRGKKLVASPVKEVALELGIPVFTPASMRAEGEAEALAALEPDALCVAAYGAILPQVVLDAAPLGAFNVHTSLLPRWRGAAPVERAILAGDADTGVSIMRMEAGLDTGDWCLQHTVAIDEKTAGELTADLAVEGAQALVEALAAVEQGSVVWTPQGEADVTYAHKIEKGELDPSPADDAATAARKVQATSKAHRARCTVDGRGVALIRAHLVAPEAPDAPSVVPAQGGVIYEQGRLFLGCADGAIEILEIQPDGKQPVAAKAFAAGTPRVRASEAVWKALGD